jgi:hypothetical protein
VSKGRHATFNDGYSLSAIGISDIQILQAAYGDWEIPEGDSFLFHPTLSVELLTKEITGFSSDAPSVPFEGADVEVQGAQLEPFSMASFALTSKLYQFNNYAPYFGTSQGFPESFQFSDDGHRAWMLGYRLNPTVSAIFEYRLLKPFDIETLEPTGNFIVPGSADLKSFRWSAQGNRFFVASAVGGGNGIYQYECSTPYDITTFQEDRYFDLDGYLLPANKNVRGLEWGPDGRTLTVVNIEATLHQFRTIEPFDIQDMYLIGTFDLKTVSDLTLSIQGMRWIDPYRFILVNVFSGKEYSMFRNDGSVPYGIQGITQVPGYFSFGSSSTRGLEYRNGSLFTLQQSGSRIREARLQNFDVSLKLDV